MVATASPPTAVPAAVIACALLHSTSVETYVRDIVEMQAPFEEDGMHQAFIDEVMAALFAAGVSPPVSAVELARTLQAAFPAGTLATEFGPEVDFLPRMLKTLNGPAFQLVPPSILAEAAARERAVSSTTQGWGVSEPPPAATAYRLLVSCGLPPDLLPPYKTLPPGIRGALMQAWTTTCRTFNWTPYHPECDLRAEKRLISRQIKRDFKD